MSLGTVVIGGGSGFVGRALTRKLGEVGYDTVTISRTSALGQMAWTDVYQKGLPPSCVAVINVAGQNVLDPKKRWTADFRREIHSSRIDTTNILAEKIKEMSVKPLVFATISGVGYYRPSDVVSYTEESSGGDHDYFSRLCTHWEAASQLPAELKVRQFTVRSGVVLGRSGGMIKQLYWPFYFGVGGPIATGKQYMPWIHIEDIAGIFVHGIQHEKVNGILNGVAPEIITNKEFTKAFARAMWRPALFPLPAFAVNLMFGKERAVMMLEGQKVLPERTLQTGYKFYYPDIKSACKEIAHPLYDFDQ